jgi:putative transposase
LSTKVHAATDALGNPVRLLFGPGQRHDATRSHELIDGFEPDAVIADKGYDADRFREAIRDRGAEAVIPPRSNRKAPCDYDKALYRERNLAERFFNKLNHVQFETHSRSAWRGGGRFPHNGFPERPCSDWCYELIMSVGAKRWRTCAAWP